MTSISDEPRSPDDEIRRQVLEAFKRRGYPSLGGLSVAVQEGNVRISGRLPTFYLRQVAQTAALSVRGVDRVEFGFGSVDGRRTEAAIQWPPGDAARRTTMTNAARESHQTPVLLGEHARIDQKIDELREWRQQLCQLGQPRFGELGTRLKGIRESLSDHFASEESGGYLAQALAQAPQLASKAESLRRQHATFLANLDTLADRLTATPARFNDWSEACQEFDDFLSRLQLHEEAENDIVTAALDAEVEHAG